MVIALCVDDQYGLLFNGRRQSRDRVLLDRLLETDKTIWMNSYSAKMFSQLPGNVSVQDNFMQAAGPEDICFVENVPITDLPENCDQLILYHWNRKYPADLYFPAEELKKWKLVSTYDFPGNSHDKITEKIYEKE